VLSLHHVFFSFFSEWFIVWLCRHWDVGSVDFRFRIAFRGNCLNGGFIIILNEKYNNKTVHWPNPIYWTYFWSLIISTWSKHIITVFGGPAEALKLTALLLCGWNKLRIMETCRGCFYLLLFAQSPTLLVFFVLQPNNIHVSLSLILVWYSLKLHDSNF